MIPETALTTAGPDAQLVARPAGVAHIYTGPLTPSGRHVPRSARTVCRARTRQLHVLTLPERWTSLDSTSASPRMCARCTARLDRDRDRSRRATSLCTRHAAIEACAGTTKADIGFALQVANTPAEVDAAAWLSLLLFEAAGCTDGFVQHGRSWDSLHTLVAAARRRVGGYPDRYRDQGDRSNAIALSVREIRKAENKAAWEERQNRIRRLGINIAEPPRGRRPS